MDINGKPRCEPQNCWKLEPNLILEEDFEGNDFLQGMKPEGSVKEVVYDQPCTMPGQRPDDADLNNQAFDTWDKVITQTSCPGLGPIKMNDGRVL